MQPSRTRLSVRALSPSESATVTGGTAIAADAALTPSGGRVAATAPGYALQLLVAK